MKGFAGSAAFAMGKFALRGLGQGVARELAPKGIRVVHVVIDGGVRNTSRPVPADRQDSLPDPDAIAQSYLDVLRQPRSAWSSSPGPGRRASEAGRTGDLPRAGVGWPVVRGRMAPALHRQAGRRRRMDLNTIRTVLRPTERGALPSPAPGDAFLAGGTWLFSEPQRDLARLIDLQALRWEPIRQDGDTLRVAATCTLATLDAHAADAGTGVGQVMRACCRALWGSFKIWNMATVGGNLCLALPAAPMAALAVALDGRCTVWCPDGRSREVAAAEFILGAARSCLRPGEVLRGIDLSAGGGSDRYALRQMSLTTEGRSAALLIGRVREAGFALTVTASLPRPLRLEFTALPDRETLAGRLDAEGGRLGWHDDVHGAPDWRRQMTLRLAGEIRDELAA